MYYFAFGSNMSLPRLRQRAPSAAFVAVASLHGHQLRIHKAGRDGSGKCDASHTACKGDLIHGVLYRLDQKHKVQLDAAEGLGRGYEQKAVGVTLADGSSVRAFTYYATHIDTTMRPYSWYLEHVVRGALQHGLPDRYVKALLAIESIEDPNAARHQMEMSIYDDTNPGLESGAPI